MTAGIEVALGLRRYTLHISVRTHDHQPTLWLTCADCEDEFHGWDGFAVINMAEVIAQIATHETSNHPTGRGGPARPCTCRAATEGGGHSHGCQYSPEYGLQCQHCDKPIRELNGFWEDQAGFTYCGKDLPHKPMPEVVIP